jgi:hypothetical protein
MTSRKEKFDQLGDIGRTLMLKLYVNLEAYLSIDVPYDLENYIFSYDTEIYHQGIIVSIGQRIGISLKIEEEFETSIQFFDILMSILDKVPDRKLIDEILNMNEGSFNTYLRSRGLTTYVDNDYVYADRLILLSLNFEDMDKYDNLD